MRHAAVLFLCGVLQSIKTSPVQNSVELYLGTTRHRRTYSDHRQQHERTAMDMIIELNGSRDVHVDDGVSLREGDIAVSRSQKGCFARSCLWSKSVDGHVYVAHTLSPKYSDVDGRRVRRAMELIERGTCVRFVPRTHQRDYLDIQPKSGCWSYLGAGGGRQILSLHSPHCMGSGVVSHQLLHALGLVHEQSRADRDKYVTIMWPNISRDHLRNFEKFKTNNLDTPYDYGSVMHFGKFAYSQHGEPTVLPKRSWNVRMGQRFGPSELDIMKINKLYKCT
ncbi:hatching enzyme 1.2 [Brachyhypopomus gauderio]|uniref:hatching enzyme 1.2 n=1 Tax=Brachyhypopomus gauderio TaxID=698409 RepID=UPI0040421E9E